MIWLIGPTIPRLLSIVVSAYAVTVYPFVFVRTVPSVRTIVHEEVHGKQWVELALTAFVILLATSPLTGLGLGWVLVASYLAHGVVYSAFWLFGLARTGSRLKAYRRNPFEREAFAHEGVAYLATRRPFGWVGYVRAG